MPLVWLCYVFDMLLRVSSLKLESFKFQVEKFKVEKLRVVSFGWEVGALRQAQCPHGRQASVRTIRIVPIV